METNLSLPGILLITLLLQNGISNAQIQVHKKGLIQQALTPQPDAFPVELVPLLTTSSFRYSLSNLPSDVSSAQKICQMNGGSLLSLQTPEELESLKQNLPHLLQDDIIWTSAIRFTNSTTENLLIWPDTSQPFEYPLKASIDPAPTPSPIRHPRNIGVHVEIVTNNMTTAAPTTTSKCPCTCSSTSDPPTSAPPTSDPPTSAPPTSDPPTSAPPTSDPPTSDPPTSAPPTTASPNPPICNRPICTGHRPPCTELQPRTCIIKSPPVCDAHEKNCTVKCDGPCQILRQPICKVVAPPDCQLVTPNSVQCKTTTPSNCTIVQPGVCHSLEVKCHMDNTPCIPQIKPCKNPCSKQDCQTVTPPCTTPRSSAGPSPTCPPAVTTCTKPFVDCSPEICQSNVIICPPRKLHCPPAQVNCTEPVIECDDPEVECPEPEVICGEPRIECEKPLVKCPDPVVHCDTIITTCERPAFFCSDPVLDCPPIEKNCTNATCTPPPALLSIGATPSSGKCGGECCRGRSKRDVQQVEDEDGEEKTECIAMITGGGGTKEGGWIAQNCNLEHRFICKMS